MDSVLVDVLGDWMYALGSVVTGFLYVVFLAVLFGSMWMVFCIATNRRPGVLLPGTFITVLWAIAELGIIIPLPPYRWRLNFTPELNIHWYDPIRWVLIGFGAALIAKIGMRYVRPLPRPKSSDEAAEPSPPTAPPPD